MDKNLAYDGDVEESGDADEFWDAEEDESEEESIDGTNEVDLGGGEDGDNTTVFLEIEND